MSEKQLIIYGLNEPNEEACEEIRSQLNSNNRSVDTERTTTTTTNVVNSSRENYNIRNRRGNRGTESGVLRLSKALVIGGSVGVDGQFRLTNSTVSSGPNSGALIVNGGVGVGRNIVVGGTGVSTGSTSGALVVAGGVGIGKNIVVGGTGVSTGATSGALVVSGGVGIGGDLYIGGSGPVITYPPQNELPLFSMKTSNVSNLAWTSICWSSKLKIFCAVAGNIIGNSTDGINWITYPVDTKTWISVSWSDYLQIFCVISNDRYTMTSTDGVSWTITSVPGINRIQLLEDKYFTIVTERSSTYLGRVDISKGLYTLDSLLDHIQNQIYQTITNNNTELNLRYDNWLESSWSYLPSNRVIFRGLYRDYIKTWNLTLTFYNKNDNNLDSVLPALLGYTSPYIHITNYYSVGESYDVAAPNEPSPPINITTINLSCITWSPYLNKFCILSKKTQYYDLILCASFLSSDGINWSRREITQNDWNSICWSSGLNLFCAVSTGQNCITTSSDGINWLFPTINSSIISNNWVSICWSPTLNLFCAVADNDTNNKCVITSNDGVIWNSSITPTNNRTSVIWSNEFKIFCAIGLNSSQSIISTNGLNWITKDFVGTNTIKNWSCISVSPELKVICGLNQNHSDILIVTDTYELKSASLLVSGGVGIKGNTYILDTTESNDPTSGALIVKGGVGIGGNLRIGGNLEMSYLNVSNTGAVMTNPPFNLLDKWVVNPANVIIEKWNAITWSPVLKKFYAVGNSLISSSSDGYTWENINTSISGNWISIIWHFFTDKLYAISDSVVIMSSNGINWSEVNMPINTINVYTITITQTKKIYIKSSWPSVDGMTYTPHFIILPGTYTVSQISEMCQFKKIDYGYGLEFYLGLTYNNNYFTFSTIEYGFPSSYVEILNNDDSPDTELYSNLGFNSYRLFFDAYNAVFNITAQNTVSYTVQTFPMTFSEMSTSGNTICIITKNTSRTPFISSVDGMNWNYYNNDNINKNWNSICWSPTLGLFCAVSDGNTNNVSISSDGINWSFYSVNSMNTWVSICWSPSLNLFCAVCNNSINNKCVMTSPNGINWTLQNTPLSSRSSVIWHPDLKKFYSINTSSNVVMYSNNGINWLLENIINNTDGSTTYSIQKVVYSPELKLICGIIENEPNILSVTSNYTFTTGSILKGGVGIQKNLIIADTTETNDLSSGSVITQGGLSVKKSITIGEKINLLNNSAIGNPTIGTYGGTGTKLVLSIGSNSSPPYALGVNNNMMWYGVPSSASHVFYGGNMGTTELLRINSNGSLLATAYNTVSDSRLKTNITDMSSMTERIKQMKCREFDWTTNNTHSYGFIAQEIYTLFPELQLNDTNYYSLDYGKFTPYLTKALQETMLELENTKSELEQLKSKVKEILEHINK